MYDMLRVPGKISDTGRLPTMKRLSSFLPALCAVLLVASCTSSSESVSTSQPAVTASDTTVLASTTATSPATTATTGSAAVTSPLEEIDLETNVTVFFDPTTVTDRAQAEAAILEVIGDADVESVTILDRTQAWSEVQALTARAPTLVALDPSLQASLGEVARVVILDQEVRNRVTDDIEDSPDVVGIAYVAGVRPAQNIDLFRPMWVIWETLGFFWQPTS